MSTSFNDFIIKKIRAYQVKNNLTNALLAEKIGVSQPTVSYWGRRRNSIPHPFTIKKMVELGILSNKDIAVFNTERERRLLSRRQEQLNRRFKS